MSPPPSGMAVVQTNGTTNTTNASAYNDSSPDSLPKQFVGAMRTLFDIMDDKGAGFVKFSDIEKRWQDDGTKGLPKGVIESIRKVTPPNGLLSFERFCAGLKMCLLKNQMEGHVAHNIRNAPSTRPPPAPIDTVIKPSSTQTQWNASGNTATVRPNNVMCWSSTSSSSSVLTKVSSSGSTSMATSTTTTTAHPLHGPPKPPRTNLVAPIDRSSTHNIPMATEQRSLLDKQEIRNVLHNWQLGLIGGATNNYNWNTRGGSDPQLQSNQFGGSSNSANSTSSALVQSSATNQYKKVAGATVRRKEPRRHTLQNGVDYNMLKRMKQIEQEKQVLMQGLQAVERAHDWYIKQIATVQEKIKYLGRMPSHMEQWSEAQQERLELQRARVLEVNRHLATLTDCGSDRAGGLPWHMNLAISHHSNASLTDTPPHVHELKRQNHLLNEELSKKLERITLLEREKASLMRELYQNRGRALEMRKTDQHQLQGVQPLADANYM